jgi:rod shape-determining protein MreC
MRGRGLLFQRRSRQLWRIPTEFLTFTLYFFCTVLLVLSRLGHEAIVETRDGLVDLTGPLLEAASVPAIKARQTYERAQSYVGLAREIDRLKAENAQLKQWEWRAKLLERKVVHLRSLLNAADEAGLQYATGSVIADARGPFLRSALINLGKDDGIRIGHAVINGDGLIGRTVDAGSNVARVLLLNDLNSRIPVLVGPAGVRGLASGNNSAELQLDFLPDGAALYPGDEVYTSGSDGVLPRGLRVGVVTGSPGKFKVRPYAELNSLDAVSVLLFEAPALMSEGPAVAPVRTLSANTKSEPEPRPSGATVSVEAHPVNPVTAPPLELPATATDALPVGATTSAVNALPVSAVKPAPAQQ